MAQQSTKDQVKPKKKGFLSPFFAPLRLTLSALTYVSIAALIAIVIEWLGIVFFWPVDHSQTTFFTEIEFLGDRFSTSIAGSSPAELALRVATVVNGFLTDNALVNYFTQVANNPQSSKFDATIGNFVRSTAEFVEAALFVLMTISIRLTVIVLSSLLLILTFLVSAVDGLTERELRRFGGDIDHSRIVHIALYWAPRLIVIAPVAYLAWPHIANPVFFFIPALLAYAFTNYTLISQYQKRL